MKKLYSKSSLVRTVTLGAAVATLLSSVSPIVSPVFAAGVSTTGGVVRNSSGTDVPYPHGNHGSIVFAGDDDFCGADNVVGRGGKQQASITDNRRISAKDQYERFVGEKQFGGRSPYGTTTEKETWIGDGVTSGGGAYMGTPTGGIMNALPEAYGIYSFATGCGSAATGNYSTVFGAGATAKAGGAQAFGVSALAGGIASVAMGVDSEAAGKSAVAVGGLATALGNNSVAMGTKARAESNYAIAIGSEAEAQASGAIAIGSRRSDRTEENDPNRKVEAKAENAIAIGTFAYAETEDSVAIGVNSQVLVKDGVAVGGGAISDRDKGMAGYDPHTNVASTKTGIAWKSTTAAFSVGEVGGRGNGTLTRQITGVAAGSQDTDAVNVAQLKALRSVIAEGEGWKISVNDKDSTDVTPGSTVDFSVTYKEEAGKDNLKIEKESGDDKQKVKFSLNENLNLVSVTTGQASMSDDGFVIQGGPKITADGFIFDEGASITVNGVDAGSKSIFNVADATEDDEAVTYRQLKEVQKGIKTSWTLSVNGKDATTIGPNGGVNLQSAGDEDNQNIHITKNKDNTVEFGLADDINVISVTTGGSIMSDNGFGFEGNKGPRIALDGIDAGNEKITKVKAGTDATDAVNYKQLQDFTAKIKTGWKLAVEDGEATDIGADSTVKFVAAADKDNHKNINIVKGNDNAVTFDLNQLIKVNQIKVGDEVTISDNGLVIQRGPSITYGGIDAGNKVIRNVEEGILDTDAVNLTQLRKVEEKIKEVSDNGLVKWVEGQKFITIGAEKDGTRINITNSQGEARIISGVDAGNVATDSTEAVNGGQLFRLSNAFNSKITDMGKTISQYFGGGSSYENGIWTNPTFNILQPDKDGIFTNTQYDNVADAFRGVNSSITNLHNKIFDITENSLVKWDEDGKFITIGAEKGGIEIKVANSEGENRIISGVAVGKVSSDSTEAINGHQLFNYAANISEYFGGETDVIDGFKPTFTVQNKEHHNVTDAFTDVDASITDIYNQINNVTDNSLVKWVEGQKLITIGAEKGGTKIDITGTEGERTIAGVKNGTISAVSKEAINGSQINKISGDIAEFFGGNAAFQDGAFVGPRYNLSIVSADGTVKQGEYTDVGSALTGLDANVKNVNSRLTYVTNEFNQKFDDFSKDALLWSEGEQAFVALHGPNGEKTESKITYLLDGDISEDSTDAINGSQLYIMGDKIANYFGGGANVLNGKAPTYIIQGNRHNDVGSAFEDVNTSITDIYNQINNVTENTLVKQEGGSEGLITVGKATGGTKISIANKNNEDRTLSGVKDGMISQTSTEAVNGSQLFKTNKKVDTVYDNLLEVAENTSKYFGGNTDVLEGIEPAFLIQGKTYHNVTDAFTGVNTSITNIDNKIIEMKENNLVQQEGVSGVITIGAKTAGTKISVAGVGGAGRTIADVKDGRIAEESHDAINGSQINEISGDIANYFGGGTSFENGAFKGPKYSLSTIVENGQVAKTNYYNVGDALTGLDANVKSVNNRLTNVSNEFNQKIEGISKDALLWDDEEQAFVARHEKDGEKTKSKLTFLMNGEIHEESTDAINGSQLYFMSNQLAAYFGGGAKYQNGKWTAPNFVISQVNADGKIVENKYNNVAEAFGGINNGMSNINNRIDDVINKVDSDALKWNKDKGAYDAGRDGKPSKIINVADGKIEKGSKDAVNGGQLWETNERVTSVEKDVKHLNNRVDNIYNTIDDISDVVINIGGKVENINNRVDNIEKDAVRYDRDANGKKVNKVTLIGGNESEPVTIDNVADGKIEKGSKEAVNGGQLHGYTKEQMKIVLDESKHYTDQRVNNIVIDAIDDAVERANNYTNMKFEALNYSIENVRKEAKQAAAIGLAVSNLRYNETPGKLSVAFGSGLWRGQSAFALGAGYSSEDGKIRSNLSATSSGGHWGVGLGLNLTLN